MSTDRLMVQTADGPHALADGIIYAHEHLCLDLATPADPQGKLDQFELIAEEIGELKQLGVGAIIEQTCRGMGRDVTRLRDIQLATGVQIIPATGYYHRRFHPPTLAGQSVEQIAEPLAKELRAGMDGTTVRPMILGEIGGSGPPLHNDEVKVFRAVARVAQEFPVVVTTHTHLGGGGGEEMKLLMQEGLAAERVLIGHLDLCPSLEEVLAIARQGAYVGFDTAGKINYAPDERRVAYIKALIDAGLEQSILLSCDISRNTYLRRRGGHGYAYLVRVFLPMLAAASIPPATIQQITQENPRRFLAGAASLALSQED
jgi:phosphotriesterase-related protein